MMGLPPGAALGRMSPEELRRATFAALRSLISRLVAAGPRCWCWRTCTGPTRPRFTSPSHLAALAADRPLLILATTRPDAGPGPPPADELAREPARPVPGPPHRSSAAAPRRRAGTRPVPDRRARPAHEVLDTVLDRRRRQPAVPGGAAGLAARDRERSLREPRRLAARRGEAPGVPQVLERLVRSRVDRLEPRRPDAVRAASVLGAEFSAVAADRGLRTPATAGAQAVAELRASGISPARCRAAPEPAFRFRHALIQEATYNGLLRAERRRLHGRAAWALEAARAGRPERSRPRSASTSPRPGRPSGPCATWSWPATTPPRCSPTTRRSRCSARPWPSLRSAAAGSRRGAGGPARQAGQRAVAHRPAGRGQGGVHRGAALPGGPSRHAGGRTC